MECAGESGNRVGGTKDARVDFLTSDRFEVAALNNRIAQ